MRDSVKDVTVVGMLRSDVPGLISVIVVNLQQARPDWEFVDSTLFDLIAAVRRQVHEKACLAQAEIERLETALTGRDTRKALRHAEAALRIMG
jgi:hypothetical protein